MHYVIESGWNRLIIPVTKETSAAISLIFEEDNVHEWHWFNDGMAFWKSPRPFDVKVISDQELKRAYARSESSRAEKEANQD
jgi:hypothetical protein